MKVTLYMATSIDGYIAKRDGDSDWVSEVDGKIFQQKITEAGCIVVGRRTFDQYQGELYPVKGITNIVLTTNGERKSELGDVIFTTKSPQEIIQIAKDKGHDQIMVIGGGTTNGSFLRAGGIDEIFLSVHPLILGKGIKLFENCEVDIKLELIGVKQLEEDLVQLHYKVKKS